NGFAWADRPTLLKPPFDGAFAPGTVTEIHPQAEAFVATIAERLTRGAAFFVDYGFPEAEYYHPQRDGGTLMCHKAHLADTDPLIDIGAKDITAHVDFTGIALAAQNAGLEQLRPCVDRDHAGHRRRGRRIDRHEARMRIRRTQERDVRRALDHDVVGELSATRQQARVFDTLDGLAAAEAGGGADGVAHRLLSCR
ncbi:MAG: SAM-dependent methyltransferase, partial [Rhizobiales bacterium]|nr:SAM-dependent methyltransferase [Rhizobacter sp.]